MIHIVSGNPGSGKSYYVVRTLCWLLRHDTRPIVTNLPFREKELAEWFGRECKGVFQERVDVLSTEEVGTFWRYRGWRRLEDGRWLRAVGTGGSADGATLYDGAPGSVVYLLDELHLHFNPKLYAKMARECLWYTSQHRHFGDDLWCITQRAENLDRQFRELAQDYTYCRNLGHENFMSFFRLPRRLTWQKYLDPYMRAGSHSVAVGTYQIDCGGIGALYDTSGGVGVDPDQVADKNRRAHGLPIWVFFAAAAVFVMVAVKVIDFMARGGVKAGVGWLDGVSQSAAGVKRGGTNSLLSVSGVAGVRESAGVVRQTDDAQRGVRAPEGDAVPAGPRVFVSTVAYDPGGRFLVMLSDGRDISDQVVRVEWGHRRIVLRSGVEWRY